MTRAAFVLAAGLALAVAASGRPEPVSAAVATASRAAPQSGEPDVDEMRWLLKEIDRLTGEVRGLRRDLARARFEAQEAQREVGELRRFIEDNEALGADFARYRDVKAVAEREARRREAEANRRRLEAERAERRSRFLEARAEREREDAESRRLERYENAGFGAIGLDVFASRMGYAYETRERNPVRVDYDPWLGLYYRPGGPTAEIDYGRMTLSGSVLNAAEVVRNVGVAVTFFDKEGNQVGSTIVRVNNARPDVPYPFTSSVDMALDRPFASASTYVLYADPVE